MPISPSIPFEDILAQLTDGLLMFNTEGQATYMNASAQSLLGLPATDSARLTTSTLWEHPRLRLENRETANQKFFALLNNVDSRPRMIVNLVADDFPAGEAPDNHSHPTRELEVELFPVQAAGQAAPGLGLILRDVTRERERTHRKDELVNLVSHELRTPLTNILCFADLLLTREFNEPQAREMLGTIYREAKRLSALLADFLNLRRLESGPQSLHISELDLAELVTEILSGYELSQGKYQVALELNPHLPRLQADRERLGQALRNLLDNAFKYSPHGGRVTIAAHLVGTPDALYVTVTDAGLGLPPDDIPRLFRRFYRINAPDREAIEGTGLGLAIVKQIITRHGGRVWAESAGLGQGSTFGFTLPLKPNYRY
jgi:signal transduction histidine kinase